MDDRLFSILRTVADEKGAVGVVEYLDRMNFPESKYPQIIERFNSWKEPTNGAINKGL